MKHRFSRHYTRDEARRLLPEIREWLAELNRLRVEVDRYEQRLSGLNTEGQDTGGETVNKWIRALAAMQQILADFRNGRFLSKICRAG